MREKDFQTQFAKKNTLSGVFELKFCKGTSLPFSSLAEHQEKALLAATSKEGLFHKITDAPFFKDAHNKMRFTRPKPFDCFYLQYIPAYVVVMWWEPRKKKNVYYIPIYAWISMRELVKRKSITEQMAEDGASRTESYLKK
ncbi:hypothetical protein KAU11_03285 [Candidatus Babeliales bacterium]|nr:hypothetical protein [Candidatus Babeliales bacterium]